MEGKKIFYKPGEFAKAVGVSVKTLQRWDNEGILKADRTPGGRRQYTAWHIIELRRRAPGTNRGEEIYNANLWFSPCPLESLENGYVYVDPRFADCICHVLRQECGASSMAEFAMTAKYAGHDVALSPVVAAAGPDVLSGMVMRIDSEKIKEQLLVADRNLTPGCVELGGSIPVIWTDDDKPGKNSVYRRLFNSFKDEKGNVATKFIYAEPGFAMVFFLNIYHNEGPSKRPHVADIVIALDKYLTGHPEIKDLVCKL